MRVIDNPRDVKLPLSGSTDLLVGALLVPDTAEGAYKLAPVSGDSASVADAIGILNEPFDASEDAWDASAGEGTKLLSVSMIDPGKQVELEYDPDTSVAVTAYDSSTGVITVGAIDTTCTGGWVYVVSGPGIGQIGYIAASDTSGETITMATPFSTDVTTASEIIVIWPRTRTSFLTADAYKISGAPALGSYILPAVCINAQYSYDQSQGWLNLDTSVSNKNVIGQSVRFRAIVVLTNTALNPID